MSKVFVTRSVPELTLKSLRDAGLEVDVYESETPVPRDELLERVPGYDALLTLLSEKVDEELLEAAGPQLEIIANFAVGYNNIDVPACTARGVAVSNTPDVLTDTTADHTLMLLLATARRAVEGDALVRSGVWRGWAPNQLLGLDVSGRTLGIIGMGRIGRAVAARAKGFGMRLIYHNRSRDEAAETELGASYRDLHNLLKESDFVSVHAPLTDETRYLLGEAELGMMKPTAVLVNTSRGPLVDERALERFLREGRIWGAGLDVFGNEPELSPGLRELPNVVLAPHTGSATTGTREAMGRLCAEAIIAVLKGERAPHLLNPEVVL